jgi:regulator of sigma E protease
MTAIVEPAAERPLAIELVRDGVRQTVEVTPRGEHAVEGDTTSTLVGKLGVTDNPPIVSEPYTFMGAIAAGNAATWNSAGMIFRTVRGLLTRRIASNQVGGPILIGQMAAGAARAGFDVLLGFMALISVNLAVVNLLPIPVLDGGAFLILAIEGIIRRPLPLKLREGIQMIGVLMVIALMILAFSNDIRRLLGFA